MEREKFKNDIMELFYGERKGRLQDVAARHNVSLAECQKQWEGLSRISFLFQKLPQESPSQISINKILAHARVKTMEGSRQPFWRWFLHPVWGVAASLCLVVLAHTLWQNWNSSQQFEQVAATQQPAVPFYQNLDESIRQRLFITPFDQLYEDPARPLPLPKYLDSRVASVSLGEGNSGFSFEKEVDLKFKDGKALNSQELETLYFRARKLEKLGYYEQALYDFLFILKSDPQFEYQKTIPLSVARCYEQLNDKKSALLFLDAYQKTYGRSEDVSLWIDQLKSETF